MISLSQTAGYAIRAMALMDGVGGKPVLVVKLARLTGIAKPYLSKLIHALAGKKLVATKRGYKGGVTLARPASEITLLEVADAVDGPGWLDECILGLEDCNDEGACVLHEFWKPIKEKIHRELSGKTLEEAIGNLAVLRGNAG